jgi:hypothetical protein
MAVAAKIIGTNKRGEKCQENVFIGGTSSPPTSDGRVDRAEKRHFLGGVGRGGGLVSSERRLGRLRTSIVIFYRVATSLRDGSIWGWL